ncbi:MAG: hypothetical protein COB02_15350 [Candidatus Cloacimonadota bacterium]|nr:MAG: hypothetical protein COB02_15350 [Candidatus Cloacimonadota bacterium]
MNTNKIQFFTLWLILFFILSYFFYQADFQTFTKKKLKTFKQILQQKENILQGIQEVEPFPNYDAKVRLCELISLEYLENIKKMLSQKKWKNSIKSYPTVFTSNSGIIIGKKNKKFLFQYGKNFESFFGKKWFKRFFLALKNKGTYFETIIERIYPYAISYKEFQSHQDIFKIIYKNGQFILFMHTQHLDKTILFMVHLDQINYKQLLTETLTLFTHSNTDLSLSNNDSLTVNNLNKILFKQKVGLNLKIYFPSYIKWLFNHYYLLILISFLIIYLQIAGGYRVYSVGIEYALIAITLILCILLNLVNFSVFNFWKDNLFRTEVLQKENLWKSKSKSIDNNFFSFQQNVINEINNSLNTNTLQNLSNKNKEWFIFHINKNYKTKTYPKKLKLVSNLLIRKLSKGIILQKVITHRVKSTFNKVKEFKVKHTNMVARKIIKKNDHAINRRSHLMHENNPKLFSKWGYYKDGHYIYYSKLKNWSKLENFILIMIPIPSMINNYLSSKYMKNISLIVRSKVTKKVVYPKFNFPISSFYIQKQWIQTQNTGNFSSLFNYSKADFTSLFIASKSLEDYHFFFFENLDELYNKISTLNTWYFYVQILIWICALILSYYLRQFLIKPLDDARVYLTQISSNKPLTTSEYFPLNLGEINHSITSLYLRYQEIKFKDKQESRVLNKIINCFENKQKYQCICLKVYDFENIEILNKIIHKYSGYLHSLSNNEHTILFFESIHSNYIQNTLQTAIELHHSNKKSAFTIYNDLRVYQCISHQNTTSIFLSSELQFKKSNHFQTNTILLDHYCSEALKYNYEFQQYDKNFLQFIESQS